jgi:rhodanese-related sulfurtransferase
MNGEQVMSYQDVTPEELLGRLGESEMVVLDVRTMPEWRGGHIPGAVHIPIEELAARYQELDPETETLVICAHGIRSAAAAQWLAQVGFEQVANVRYGMSAWPGPVETG